MTMVGEHTETDQGRFREVCDLASNQLLIKLGQQREPDTPIYEIPYLFRIQGEVDSEAFCEAFERWVAETPIMRLVAESLDWSAVSQNQHVARQCPFFDFTSESDAEASLRDVVNDRLASPMDATVALYDSCLVRTGPLEFCWFVKLHHLLTDGFNTRLILQQVADYYLERTMGIERPSHGRYEDFILFEHENNQRDGFESQQKWWQQRVHETVSTQFYRPASRSDCPRHRRIVVPLTNEENKLLGDACSRAPFRQFSEQLSRFNVLATVLASLLSRLSQTAEVQFGTTHHGRSTPEFRTTAGLFMQLLPFRLSLEPSTNFESLSRQVAEETRGFLQHGIPGAMQPETAAAFDVALNVLDLGVQEFAGLPASVKWLHNGFGDPHRKLTISAHQVAANSEWELLFDFNEAEFGESDQHRLVTHFRLMLREVCEHSKLAIKQVSLLSEAEIRFLNRHLRSEPACRSTGETIQDRFEAVAKRFPEKVALQSATSSLNYRELSELVTSLARQIDDLHCGPLVPVLCHRNEWAVIGFLAVARTGRAFLPVDLDQPDARIRVLIEDCQASHLIKASGNPVVEVCKGDEGTTRESFRDACYVLYTSGSTGRPNGVAVGHRSLLNLLDEFEDLVSESVQRCSWWTNVGFDVAMYEVFSALLFGRTLCIPDAATRSRPQELFRWFEDQKIDSAYLPPFFVPEFAEFAAGDHSLCMRRLLVGVEPIPQSTLAKIGRELSGVVVINGYGPTEATVCATLCRIDCSDVATGPASIGRPIRGNVLRIVDDAGNDVPPGVPGELWIGGVGLALGYINGRLNQQRFVQDAGGTDGLRWYRSGDRVRLRSDGNLSFVGRIDAQIKIRGHRIEPGEIIAAIRAIAGVSDCIVEPVSNDGGETHLVAWVSATTSVGTIRTELVKSLPRHLVPSKITILDGALPRTINGKPDTEALLAEDCLPSSRNTRVAPCNVVEMTICTLWGRILGVEETGVTCNLLELGGDSLDVLRFIGEAEQLGLSFTMSQVFEHPTVRELSQLAEEVCVSARESVEPPLSLGKDVDLQLSEAQKGLWYLDQTSSYRSAYYLQLVFGFSTVIDEERLSRCVDELTRRHESLRLAIQSENGEPFPAVNQRFAGHLLVSAISSRAALEGLAESDLEQEFRLHEGRLVRLRLVTVADGASTLVLTAHHIVFDQASALLLLEELAELYESDIQSRQPRFRFQPANASDFAIERSIELRRRNAEDLTFWKDQLSNCRRHINLPRDRDSRETGPGPGALFRFQMSAELSAQVRQFASSRKVTRHNLLLAAFQALLFRYSHESRFVIGVPVSHRARPDFAGAIGYLVESFPFPAHVDTEMEFIDLVTETDARFRAARKHHKVPASELMALVGDSSEEAPGPVFETMFVMQSEFSRVSFGDAEMISHSVSDGRTAKFDLTLFVAEGNAGLECMFEYRTGQFDESTVRRMSEHWVRLLSGMLDSPQAAVVEIDYLTDRDRQAMQLCNAASVSETFDRISVDRPEERSVVRQFDLHALTHPDQVAVSCDGNSLTYGELARQADEVALSLANRGVRNGHAVALLCERSCDMIVSVLGILKAGAAYVPLDPDQPADRLLRLISDAGVVAAVVSESLSNLRIQLPVPTIKTGALQCEEPVCVPLSGARTEGLAYVMYTSGSTGTPKGVEVMHKALWKSTMARQEYYADNPSAFLMMSPLWFDSSVAGVFWTLTTGGRLVIPSDRTLKDVIELGRLVETQQVSHLLCLPSIYLLLLRHSPAGTLTLLRASIVAGETCARAVLEEHLRLIPGTRLFNEYGPTEASVWATCCELTKSSADAEIFIGKAVPGVTVHVLDSQMNPVPAGVEGEIFLGGVRLARGYRGAVGLTRERFVESPFGRLYRTGDLARCDSSGNLRFTGRADDQFKINGQRLEPDEIENALLNLPNIDEVAVSVLHAPASVGESVEDLTRALDRLDTETANLLVCEAEKSSSSENSQPVSERIQFADEHINLELDLKREGFIATPRDRQRKWMIQQTLAEVVDDLQHLDRVAHTLVSGSDQHHVPRDLTVERLSDQEIMEDWQTPLMNHMVDYACRKNDDVLEIGFGRGVASTFIQSLDVASHTIVEMNPHSISDHFIPWRALHELKDIRLVEGRWQDNLDDLETYDSVFFHAFPMNEDEFEQYVLRSATFAEHFFEHAARLLRPGGVFTYLSTEIDSLSRRHQRSLLDHFSEIQLKVVATNVPESTRDAWWAKSMVVVRAVR